MTKPVLTMYFNSLHPVYSFLCLIHSLPSNSVWQGEVPNVSAKGGKWVIISSCSCHLEAVILNKFPQGLFVSDLHQNYSCKSKSLVIINITVVISFRSEKPYVIVYYTLFGYRAEAKQYHLISQCRMPFCKILNECY